MKKSTIIFVIICLIVNSSCEDYVEIDTPNFQIVNENVFSDESTALAAMQGIYNELSPSFFTGAASTHMGMSGNLIEPRIASLKYDPYYQHDINTLDGVDATDNLRVWSSAYNMIYLTNSLIEGVKNSSVLSEDLRNSLLGQALFIRAWTYFYLTNFYGDVPLLLSTDYEINATAPRVSAEEVWLQIESDLDEAIALLQTDIIYPEEQRFYVTQNVAFAFKARVCLYREDWSKAEEYSSKIIAQSSDYEMLDDLEKVFLRNSKEAIWQIDPIGSTPRIVTAEGLAYVIRTFLFGLVQGEIVLSQDFVNDFSGNDKRLMYWVGTYQKSSDIYPYINKYKEYVSNSNNSESSVVLRLAEQYLIRSEARLRQNKLDMAIKDIDVIRHRAGIDLIVDTNPEITSEALLDTIMEERKKELFGEYGHHWLDLKRTKNVLEEFVDNPSWQDTDIWYPIPEQERLKNPNLGQNEGY
ncbi:RagB/SusD family nutrient uptake outer membrane protein [Bizionia sp.]|uniref:RagB/SusD family nutrient uptake outer membrane protein n=1 Tax=Bizionia sp. TaxID=1954480 RepID=UPI003A9282D4